MWESEARPILDALFAWLWQTRRTGSDRAGKQAAAIQCLFYTARRYGLAPYAWLRDPLETRPTWPYSRIDELLPLRCASSA